MILLNALQAMSVRLLIPWVGAWVADVDFDLDVPVPPSGPALITIDTSSLVGTIDPDRSGRFSDYGRARVIAGAGGWRKNVKPLHFTNPGGLLSNAIISATAAEVLERAIVPIPKPIGTDYMRASGPAYEVLRGESWYVDFQGITQVSPRIPKPYDPTSVDILHWDPERQRAEVAADAPIMPGSIIVDPRFGQAMVRDVELVFDRNGSRGFVWCSTGAAVSSSEAQLGKAIGDLVRAALPLAHLRTYRYRVVSQSPDGKVVLQNKDGSAPALAKIAVWPGVQGAKVKLKPTSEVVVAFADADPSKPMIVSFDDSTPLEMVLDAATRIALGGDAATHPVPHGDALLAWATNVNGALNALSQPIAPLLPTSVSSKVFV